MDYVFVPVWQIKGMWYFVTSSLVVASFLFCSLSFGVCSSLSLQPLFVNPRLGFVADLCRLTCLFIHVLFERYQVEDVYLVPLVGSEL